MDQEIEDEFLLHVAAGADLPTALAVLPQDESAAPANRGLGWIMFVVFVAALAGAWLLSR